MMQKETIETLLKYVLPDEMVEYFELARVNESEQVLHLYLDELDNKPTEYKEKELFSNGFYEESLIKDYPLRGKKVVLHVRRRRWVDSLGKSYSRKWELTAEGTRYSKEFAVFLKELYGYISDTSPIS